MSGPVNESTPVSDEQEVSDAVIAAEMGAPYDEAKAEKAWSSSADEARALADDALEPVNTNLASAAFQAMKTHEAASEPPTRARMQKLAPDEFDAGHIDRMKTYSWAALYVQRKSNRESANATRAQVPPEVIAAARSLRAGMLKVLDYNLGDDPAIASELTGIRAGTGHVDLADDLAELADLYAAHHALLALDGRRYDPKHASEARRLSDAIFTHLGASASVKQWIEARARIFTLLKRSHAEVLAAATFLFRNEPTRLARFPSLYVPTSKPSNPKSSAPAEAPAIPAEPAPA